MRDQCASSSLRPVPLQACQRKVFRIDSTPYTVVGEMRLGARVFPVRKVINDQINRPGRIIYLAVDPKAGPGGDLCSIHQLPEGLAQVKLVRLIQNMTRDNATVTKVLYWHRDAKFGVFVVLSWVHGDNLEDWLASEAGRWLSATESFRLYRGLVHGLSQMHARFVHGDVHPGNLILTKHSRRRLVLIDFGTAWVAAETKYRARGDGEMPAYAAPETHVGSGAVPDFRSDQFSATVVLYRMLTGELPYDGHGGKAADYGSAVADSYTRPSELSHDRERIPMYVWDGIDEVCRAGLSLEPGGRYATARDWRNAVDRVARAIHDSHELKPFDRALAIALGSATELVRRIGERFRPTSKR